jgi:hypothetical protein
MAECHVALKHHRPNELKAEEHVPLKHLRPYSPMAKCHMPLKHHRPHIPMAEGCVHVKKATRFIQVTKREKMLKITFWE